MSLKKPTTITLEEDLLWELKEISMQLLGHINVSWVISSVLKQYIKEVKEGKRDLKL